MFSTKLYVDQAWMKRVSMGLKRFAKVKPGVHVCRCPFCGDSKKSSTRARFYFYEKKGSLNVDCKNCTYSGSFFNFVRDFCPELFDEYKKETLLSDFKKPQRRKTKITESNTKPVFDEPKGFKELRKTTNCLDLPDSHPAKQYLYQRNFGDDQIKRLLYTDDFKAVASQLNKEAAKNLLDNEERIVIPFYDRDGYIKLIQGRALGKSKMKYITIKIHDDVDKTYGLETIDKSKTVYCVEGPLDSLFVDNCIATCDADLVRSDADVLIYDNQPRNLDVIKHMKRAIDEGRSLVIWPNSPNEKQDINDMIMAGISPKMLMAVIRKCTFKGLKAKVKFNEWKKV